jgi:hypothetical protein
MVQIKSMQKIVALSVTGAELLAVLETENKGAVDLVNNFSCGERTRHIETRQYYPS